MTDIAKLGFEIDTTPLSKAAAEAQKAAQQIGQVGTAAEKLGQQTKQGHAGTTALGESLGKINGTLKVSAQEMQAFAASLGQNGSGAGGALSAAGGALTRFASALGPTGLAVAGLAVGVGALAGAYVGLQSKLADAEDSFNLMEARMRNALGTTQGAQKAMADLYDQTQKTGLGFQSAADAFLRIARNAETLGATQEQILQLADTIQKLGKASGASTGEIQSGMVQLGQALASGRLNGDELRSIMENMPALAKGIADGLGVSVGQIRALGAAGELTSTKVFEAILKSSTKANEEFAKLPDTVSQANQRVADSFSTLLANLGRSLESSDFMVSISNIGNRIIKSFNKGFASGDLQAQITKLQKDIQVAEMSQGVGAFVSGDLYGSGPVASTDAEIKKMRERLARLEKQLDADRTAAGQKQIELNSAGFRQTVELGQNEYGDFQKKLEKARSDAKRLADEVKRIEAANPVMNPNYAAERSALPGLKREAAIAQAQFEGLAAGIDKATRSLTDLRKAQLMGGGGGGTAIVSSAIQQQREARGQLGNAAGSLDKYIGNGVADAAAKAQAEVAGLERQAKGQNDLASAIGKTRSELREMEIAQEVANFQFSRFGTLTGPAVTKTMRDYEAALRKSKSAADDFADSKVLQASKDALSGIERQIAAVREGAYAMREAAALSRAALADMQKQGSGSSVMQEFYAGERLSSAQVLDQMDRQNTRLTQDGNVIGDPIAQRNLRMQREIEEAQRGSAPEAKRSIADSVGERYDLERANDLKAQNTEIQHQILMTKEQVNLIGLSDEKLLVQTALIQKMNQLKQQGIDIYGEEANQILRSTEELAKQQYKIKEAQDQAERYKQIWTNAAKNIQEGIATAFEDAFKKGEFSMKAFFDLFSNVALKVSTNIISAQIIDPLTSFLTKIGGEALKAYFPSISGSPAAPASTSTMSFGPTVASAYGNSFGSGNVIPFARGGLLSQPTVFGMANGGTGVAGEAGSEAVLPLKRGNDGKLGVGAGGSGSVSIQVIDQRTSEGAKPVEIKESKGPDGQRLIQLLVRDEVRRAIRSGDLDRDMNQSFGNQRRLVTR